MTTGRRTFDEVYVVGTENEDIFTLNAAGGGVGIVSSGKVFDSNKVDDPTNAQFPYKVTSLSSDIFSNPSSVRTTKVTFEATTSLLNNLRVVRGPDELTDPIVNFDNELAPTWTITAEEGTPSEGLMEAGVTWKVQLDGIVYSYTTMEGDTDASLAKQFELLIRGSNPSREDVKFTNTERLTLRTLGGADIIQSNDTAVETIVETGAGDDVITVGFVPQIPDRGNADFNNAAGIPIVNVAHMSNGNSNLLYIYGGLGDDEFEVNHNAAELFLFGEENDDTFVINTFLVLNDNPDDPGSISNLSRLFGGTGSNRYVYLQNAPVNISGGSGTDTVVINGTAIADTFVITEKFVGGRAG